MKIEEKNYILTTDSIGVKLLPVVSDDMPFLWSAILEPAVEYTAIIRTAVPLVCAALGLVYFFVYKHTLQLVAVLHMYGS